MSRPARVTSADIARTVELLRAMGAKIASTETLPGKLKIVTTDGVGLTLPDDQETLDRGLREFIQHGHG